MVNILRTKCYEHRVLLGIAAVASLAVLVGTMKFGPGQSPDSIQYLSTAINMVNGRGAIDYSGSPLTNFPLGESTLIALGLLMGLKASVWILICNSISAFISTICSYALCKSLGANKKFSLCMALFISLCNAYLYVNSWMWSESLFILFSTSSLLLIQRYCHSPSNFLIIGLSVLIFFSFTFRYIGITLVPTMLLSILLKAEFDKSKVRELVKVSLACLVLPAIYCYWNYSRAGVVFGYRVSGVENLKSTIKSFILGISNLFLPSKGEYFYFLIAVIFILVAVALVKSTLTSRRISIVTFSEINLTVIYSYAFFYILTLLILELTSSLDQVDMRLLAPVSLELFLIGFKLLKKFSLLFSFQLLLPEIIFLVLSLSVVSSQCISDVSLIKSEIKNGILPKEVLTSNQTRYLSLIKKLSSNYNIMSNSPEWIWANDHSIMIQMSPQKTWYRSFETYTFPIAFRDYVACKKEIVLAWMPSSDWFYTPEVLRNYVKLRIIYNDSFGYYIYKVTSNDKPSLNNCTSLNSSSWAPQS